MKVKLLRNPAASIGCPLAEGETGEIPGNLGRRLVSSGLAVCLDPKPEPIKAVPDKPAIAEVAQPEIKADKPARQQPKKRKPIIDIKPKNKES